MRPGTLGCTAVCPLWLHVLQEKASLASTECDQTVETREQEALERKRESVKAILQAYRFTGTVILPADSSRDSVFSEVQWLDRTDFLGISFAPLPT